MPHAPVDLLPDEHEVPTQLGERVPMIPFLFPFDWTQRQVYWMAIWFWYGSTQLGDAQTVNAYLLIVAYLLIGVLGIVVDYLIRPTPEFWISAWLEYLAVLIVSLPLWWRRLIPQRPRWLGGDSRPGVSWPLAVMPIWLGRRLVQDAEILKDGVIRLPGMPFRRARFAVVIGIRPRAHPDLLPELLRVAMIQTRLNIFRRIRGRWSLHLEVRPFNSELLEQASGPAWEWVSEHMAPLMIVRRPALVLYGEDSTELVVQAETILDRFRQGSMEAWRRSVDETRRLQSELWSDIGLTQKNRVRIGLCRVVTGLIGYRSWAMIELPRIIHLTWLRPLTSESLLCNLAIHVSTRQAGAARRSLRRKTRQWRAVEQDEDYADAVDDANRVISAMRRNQDTAATIGIYVTAREDQATKVAEALEQAQCEFRPANIMQHRALRATRTLGGDPYGRTMQADMRTVATTDLISTAGYFPPGATLIAEALSAPEPIGINLLDEDPVHGNLNWAMFIAIMQGGGKTTTAQTLAWRMANPHYSHPLAERPIRIVSVDFKASGDYAQLYKHLAAKGHKASYNAWTSGPLPPIDGHMGFNLSDVPEDQHGAKLMELTSRIEEWSAAHSLEGAMLLVLDEILAMLEARGGPSFLRRYGTQGRSLNIAPVFCTQDIETLLANRKAALAFKNCAHVLIGRQSPAAINALSPLISLDPEAQILLADAPQGAGLLRIEKKDGPVVLGIQVRPTDWELREFGTNPAERAARWRREVASAHNAATPNGKENGHAVASDRYLRRLDPMEAV